MQLAMRVRFKHTASEVGGAGNADDEDADDDAVGTRCADAAGDAASRLGACTSVGRPNSGQASGKARARRRCHASATLLVVSDWRNMPASECDGTATRPRAIVA